MLSDGYPVPGKAKQVVLFLSTASNIPEQRAGGPRAGGVGRAGGLVSARPGRAPPLLY